MEISSIKKDATLVASGEWIADIPGMGDVRLRVRGLTSPQVVALRSRLERKAPRADRNRDGSLKHEAAVRVMKQVLHEVVLLDWDGITDGGKPVPYSVEQASTWLYNDDFRVFADAVTWAASVVDNGAADEAETLAGNSPKPSAGK